MNQLTLTSADISSLDVATVLTGARPGESVPGLVSATTLAALGFNGEEGQLVRIPASALEGPLQAPVLGVVGLGLDPSLEALRRAVGAALRTLTQPSSPRGKVVATGKPAALEVASGSDSAGSGLDAAGSELDAAGSGPDPAGTGLDPAGLETGSAGLETGSAGSNTALGDAIGLVFPPQGEPEAYFAALAEGALLGAHHPVTLLLGGAPGEAASDTLRAAVKRAGILTQAVGAVRELVNQPPNQLYPETMVQAALTATENSGVKTQVWAQNELERDGFGGLLAVGKGSIHPPYLVQLSYSPAGAQTHVGLVGKGITFDSGGLSLKPRASMATMKQDMAGAAVVLHTVLAAAALKLPVQVSGWLCLAENLPSGSAVRPSDVIIQKDGHAVEVTNTDAEGRLVLADGLAAAREAGVDQVIDIATLTGAQIVALGDRIAGVMGTANLRRAITQAAEQAGESAWEMPLPAYLIEVFTSEVADFTNANLKSADAGMLSAGVFLQQFVGDLPWAHLDIAGPAWNSHAPHGYTPKGGTGYGVRTLVSYLERV